MDSHRVRKLARRLRHTIFHPQWLLTRHERGLMEFLKPYLRGIVLDIGCAGMNAQQLVTQCGASYVGLDHPRTAMGMYGTRPNVFADAHHLPIGTESLDGILMLNVLEHLRDPDTALQEVERALKPGGACIIEVPFLYPLHDQPFDFRRWTSFGLREAAARIGLRVVSVVPIGTPAETAGLLINLALARGFLRLLAARNPFVVFGFLLPLAFAATNILARLVGSVAKDDWMPIVYRAVLSKPTALNSGAP